MIRHPRHCAPPIAARAAALRFTASRPKENVTRRLRGLGSVLSGCLVLVGHLPVVFGHGAGEYADLLVYADAVKHAGGRPPQSVD